MDKRMDFAVDIDLLEREISANEQARMVHDLTGNIGNTSHDFNGRPTSSHPREAHGEPGLEGDFNTLDEPIWVTINRDLQVIKAKFKQVLIPSADSREQSKRDWDLWGPVFICVVLSLLLRRGADSGLEFTTVFSLAFFGCCIVTLNIKLLGGKISFLQTLCVIGYCLLPTVFSAAACRLLSMVFSSGSTITMALRFSSAGVGFIWSTYASTSFLSGTQTDRRSALGIFPVVLFYFVVSWLVVAYT